MALIQCLYCGSQISDKAKKCNHCGKAQKAKKDSFWIFIIIGIIIIFGVVLFFSIQQIKKINYQKKIYSSKEVFTQAQSLENDYNYEEAIACYAKVVQEDIDNYETACTRIQELNSILNKIPDVKNAIDAINEAFPSTKASGVEEVYYAENDTNFLIANDEIHVKFVNNEKNVFYTVSRKDISEFSNYYKQLHDEDDYSSYKETEFGYTIVQWKVEENEQGMFASTIISLRNETIGYVYETLKKIDILLPVELLE